MLNEPIGYDERVEDEWTPAVGLRRAAVHGLIAVPLLLLPLLPLLLFLPYMVMPLVIRIAVTFGIAWVMFFVVHRAAGMVGPPCTALALLFTLLALLSHHFIVALHGVPESAGVGMSLAGILQFPMATVGDVIPAQKGRLVGWLWFHPYVLGAINILPLLVGGGLCAAWCRRG